jgi:hypothetical protein
LLYVHDNSIIQRSVIPCTLVIVAYIHGVVSFLFSQFPLAPLAVSLLLPFASLSTYLAPSSCDRNRPPPSQVACKLTLFAPPFTQLSHPFQLPRTPTTQRLTTTTLGLLRSCYAEQLYCGFCLKGFQLNLELKTLGLVFTIYTLPI